MRWAIVAAALVACGGQIVDEPSDAGGDSSSLADASKDIVQPKDVIVADIAPSGTCNNVPMNALLAYYPLDTDVADHSGHGNHATGYGTVFVDGLLDHAVRFQGTASLPVMFGSDVLQGPRTLCAWSRSNATTGAGQPLFWGGDTGKGDFYSFFSTAPSNTTCTKTFPSTPFVDHWGADCVDVATNPIMVGQWTLVCYAYDGASIVISVNGVENKAPGALYDYPMTTLRIGSTLGDGTTTKASFDGDIDEVSVWSTRLQSAELMALWNGGKGCAL